MQDVAAPLAEDAVAEGSTDVTLCAAFQRSAREHSARIALRTPGAQVSLTWAEVGPRVEGLAAGLAAHGVGRGDTVASMLLNRPEFHLVDWAALHLGAAPFSMYVTSPAEQVAHLLDNAGSRVIVTERAFLATVLDARARAGSTAEVFVVDGAEGHGTLDDLAAAGSPDFDFEGAWRAVEPADVACLIYTSGTTGPPKGVELTHRNLLTALASSRRAGVGVTRPSSLVSYLPHAHLADRMASHYPAMVTGSAITCVEDARTIVGLLPDARPTLWIAVPRIWEKLKPALEAKLTGVGDEAQRSRIAAALDLGRARARGETLDADGQAAYDAVDGAVFAPLRASLGLDGAETLISGAAPIAADVLEFFAAIGLFVVEAYGMSESSAVATVTRPGVLRFGTVGPPYPGVEVRLAEDGEVLVRGDVVMRGYRKEPEKTTEAVDRDGWLRTGDVGAFDDEGNLRIVDRKKEIIVNAAGKNMSPANIENAIKGASPIIGQVVAIGDLRPYNVALVVLDPEVLAPFAERLGLESAQPADLAEHPDVIAEIERAVDEGNSRLSRIEQVKRFRVLGDVWEPGGNELTPTLKLRRRPIHERYAEEIDRLYSAPREGA
jgi:long-chain acyl-CoA synthetase